MSSQRSAEDQVVMTRDGYEKLKSELSVFIDLELFTADFEYAAELFNLLRGKGIQGTSTDLLICAVALRYDLPIFTVDRDFTYYAQHIPVKLYKLECSPVD